MNDSKYHAMKPRTLLTGAALALALGCSKKTADPSSDAGSPVETPASTSASASVQAHGSHDPAYGGVVSMTSDMHFETALDAFGKHRIYFSDEARKPLPASKLAAVSIILERSAGGVEKLDLAPHESGDFWVANGKPVDKGSRTELKVSFNRPGEPATTMPVVVPGEAPADASAPADAAASRPAGKHDAHDHDH